MRKTLAMVTLMLALSCHTWAGIIHTPGTPTTPPQPTGFTQEPTDSATLNGEMQTELSKSLTQTVLELLVVLPSIL